jgi:hypothetical protein
MITKIITSKNCNMDISCVQSVLYVFLFPYFSPDNVTIFGITFWIILVLLFDVISY